jgi:hypothetical protein
MCDSFEFEQLDPGRTTLNNPETNVLLSGCLVFDKVFPVSGFEGWIALCSVGNSFPEPVDVELFCLFGFLSTGSQTVELPVGTLVA